MAFIYFLIAVVSVVATGLVAGTAAFGLLIWAITREYDDDIKES